MLVDNGMKLPMIPLFVQRMPELWHEMSPSFIAQQDPEHTPHATLPTTANQDEPALCLTPKDIPFSRPKHCALCSAQFSCPPQCECQLVLYVVNQTHSETFSSTRQLNSNHREQKPAPLKNRTVIYLLNFTDVCAQVIWL